MHFHIGIDKQNVGLDIFFYSNIICFEFLEKVTTADWQDFSAKRKTVGAV